MRSRALPLLLLLLAVPASRARAGGEVRLLTDDAIPRYLARGQELARAEQWDKVVDVLHRVVIGDPEVFPDVKEEVLHSAVYSEDGRVYYPARELCLKQLARLPPDGLRAYRDLHDSEARALFEKAEALDDIDARLAAYAKVHDDFLPSSVGDDALERAGDLNLQLGRYYEALAHYRRLIDLYPSDTDRDLALILAKAAHCAARIGDGEQREVLLERLASEYADRTVEVEGKAIRATEIRDHPRFRIGEHDSAFDDNWPVAGGSPSRNRAVPDLPEDLPSRPFWSFSLADRDNRLTAQYDRVWTVFAHDREPSPAPPELVTDFRDLLAPFPTLLPVIHDGLVLYKDGRQIVTRRLGSGTLTLLVPTIRPAEAGTIDDPRWLYPLDAIRPGTQDAATEAKRLEAVYEFVDYGGARLVIAQRTILATESPGPPNELKSAAAQMRPQPNSLVAYSRDTGKLMWAWDEDFPSLAIRRDPARLEAWQRDFQLHRSPVFLGPGVATGGILYTLARERERDDVGTVSLWAFDIEDGHVRFRTPLHYDDEVDGILPRGAAVAVAGGTVYAVTEAGVVAAVEALPPGRLRWITRYERGYEGIAKGRGGFRAGRTKQMFAFNDPVVAAGKVIVAPADSEAVLAIDAESGRIAWSIPVSHLGRAWCILGVRDGVLVLSGDKVVAIDVSKGDILWSQAAKQWPFGRGFIGEKYVHVPTHPPNSPQSYVERFELRTGAVAPRLEFKVEELGNLLSVGGRLIATNGREISCFTTYEAEIVRLDAAIERHGPRADLLLERALVALAGEPKRRDQAREDFARALAAATKEGIDDSGMRAYALDNLFAIAEERNDLGALDEADKVTAPLRERPRRSIDPERHAYDAQIALLRAEVLGRLDRGQESLAALERFTDEYGHLRVVRHGRVADGAAAGAALRDQLRAESTSFREAFAQTVRGRIEAAVESKDVAALRAIPERYGLEPPSEEAFFALADLLEEQGQPEEAQGVLEDFLQRLPAHRSVAAAWLRLARLHAKMSHPALAQRARLEGVSRLDADGRRENAALIAEVDAVIESTPPPPRPRLRLPLSARKLALEGAAAVPVDGGLPDGLALFATSTEWLAVDAAGSVKWRAANPSLGGAPPGPDGDPATAAAAGVIAAERFVAWKGEDLILGDVAGLMRIHAASGEVRWRYPDSGATARTEADAALDLLREQIRLARTTGHAMRSHPLPAYRLVGNVVVRVHPTAGVGAIHTGTGELAWIDPDPLGQVAVGPPGVLGDLVVVGFANPGWLRVYHATDGANVNTRRMEDAVLIAPPMLDPLGRLIVASSTEKEGGAGRLEIYDVRGQEPATAVFDLGTSEAAPLYADGRLLVYHDGSSGTSNLHFVDLERDRHDSRRAPDLLRAVHVAADGPRLYVLTCSPGLEDEGARLFRIDLRGMEVLTYDYAVRADAFTPPLLTAHHVAVGALLARGAHVRLFDRDASAESRGPRAVFLDTSGKETAEIEFRSGGTAHFTAGVGLAAAADGLVIGHAFGAQRMAPPAEDGG